MRIGFSVKELSKILGISSNNMKNAIDPAMEKLARLWMRNPTKTMEFLLDTVNTLRRCRAGEFSDAKMSEAEIQERICRLQGRSDMPEETSHLEHLADVATGRAVHPNDKRI